MGDEPPSAVCLRDDACARRRATKLLAIFVTLILLLVGIAPSPARASAATIALGAATAYSALGGTSVTNTGSSVLEGSVGVSPGSVLTGFPPGISSGALHRGDADAAAAQSDLQQAYADAKSRTPTGQISGDLAGQTIAPGTYSAAAAISISTVLTLDAQNDPTSIFIFQVDAAFSTAAASRIVLENGAQASNVFWQVAGAVSFGASSTFVGTALGVNAITVGASAGVTGRILSINGAVTLSSNPINSQGTVRLGTAFNYSALAATFIANTGASTLSANLGVTPGTRISGFPPGLVDGETHVADAEANQAQNDLHTAYSDAASRTPTGVLPANLDGVTLNAGTYRAAGSVALGSIVSLDARNNPNAVFVLQINGSLTTGAASQIRLMNQASPSRVFWQVSSSTEIGSGSQFAGTLLGSGAITVNTNTNFIGRALSLSASVTFATVAFQTLTPVDLGTVANYSVLGGTSVDNTGPTVVNFDVGVSPAAVITGFPPGTTSDGVLHRGDDNAAQAQIDARTAYSDAQSRSSTSSIGGDLAGMTLRSGVFTSSAAISLSTSLVLDGQNDPNAVFIFQVDAAFATAASTSIRLINGANMSRVFWQVAGAVTLGSNSTFVGNIVTPAAITAGADTTITGRLISLGGAVGMSTTSVTTPPTGILSATAGGATLSTVVLNGTTTQYAQGSSSQWTISDARNTGSGWALTISATDLVSAAGTVDTIDRTLPAENLTIDPGPITAQPGADPVATLSSTALTLSTGAQLMISSGGSNRGGYFFYPSFSLALPPNAFRSNYSGQLGQSPLNSYVTILTITIS